MPVDEVARKTGFNHRISPNGRNPIHIRVGGSVRTLREMLGISVGHLSDELGIGVQELKKYESGDARISATRIQEISKLFGVPLSYFFSAQFSTPNF